MRGPAPVMPEQRRSYVTTLGGGAMAPLEEWEWCCSSCGYRARDKDRTTLERLMRQHVCEPA